MKNPKQPTRWKDLIERHKNGNLRVKRMEGKDGTWQWLEPDTTKPENNEDKNEP